MTCNDYYNDYFDEVLMSIITKTIILIMIINYTIVANVTKDIKYNIIQTLVQVHQLSPCNSSEYQTMVNQLSLKRYSPLLSFKTSPAILNADTSADAILQIGSVFNTSFAASQIPSCGQYM